MGIFYGNVALGGGGLVLVNSLPTANATEYNKHNLYLYNGEVYYITYDSGTYDYEKLPNKVTSYTVHFIDASPYGIKVYDGQDSSGTLLVDGMGAGYETDVVCTTGYLYFTGNLGTTIIGVYVNSGGATATNPSVITGDASITVQAEDGGGGN